MKQSSTLARTMLRSPQIRELVPDLKLVLLALTVSCESHAGVYIPGGLAEDCGLDPGALAGGLEDLERRGHIVTDEDTGELFLTRFYRDNKFTGKQRQSQWTGDFVRIQSPILRELVLKAVQQSPICGITKDVFGRFYKNQGLANQGKGEGKEKPSGDGDPSPAAAPEEAVNLNPSAPDGACCGASAPLGEQWAALEKKLTDLAVKVEGRAGANEGVDRRNLNNLRQLAEDVGEDGPARVLAAIAGESWPAGAWRAAEAAGLRELAAERVAARRAEEAARVKAAQLQASADKVDLSTVLPGREGFFQTASSFLQSSGLC